MSVVHVVQVLCLAQLTYYGREELVEYVRCVCIRLEAAWVERGVDERLGFGLFLILWEQGEHWMCVCVWAVVV